MTFVYLKNAFISRLEAVAVACGYSKVRSSPGTSIAITLPAQYTFRHVLNRFVCDRTFYFEIIPKR